MDRPSLLVTTTHRFDSAWPTKTCASPWNLLTRSAPTCADITDRYAEVEMRLRADANHLIAVRLIEQRNNLILHRQASP
jgi:hypothetical protein